MHTITIYFFASVREHMGCTTQTMQIPATITDLGALKQYLFAQEGAWQTLQEKHRTLVFAVNQEMAQTDATPIAPSAEIAIFPPVTGG